jgi:hypothetical protein
VKLIGSAIIFFACWIDACFGQIPPLTLYPTTADVILGTPCGSTGTPLWRAICSQDMAVVFSTANSWTAVQSFSPSIALNGATSGSITLKAAAVAGSNTITLPAGTTDFSSTGGPNQFVRQSGAGSALTVSAIGVSDLSALFLTTNIWAALQTFSSGISSASFTAVNLLHNNTAPTVSGFCTSPSVLANNGNAVFTINVGTSCAAGTGTITLPAAVNGWVCDLHDVTSPGANNVVMTGGTATTVTVQNYSRTTGATTNFTSSDVIRAKCAAY